jgi:hypothetical protein
VRKTALAKTLTARYNNHSYKKQMETWSIFSGSDIGLALIGLAGLASVVVVLRTAFGNVAKRELTLRNNARAQSQARD